MYSNYDLLLSQIGQEGTERVKKFFEDAVKNLNISSDCMDKEKLVEDMNEAFWEDVCITADLKRILHFKENPHATKNEKEEDLLYDKEGLKHNLMINTRKGDEVVKQKYISFKSQIPSELWESLWPFFLYITAEVDLYDLDNFNLEDFETYNYIYSLGLLIGNNDEYAGNTIIEVLLKEIIRKFRKEKNQKNIVGDYDFYLDLVIKDIHNSMKQTMGNVKPKEDLVKLVEDMKETIKNIWRQTGNVVSLDDIIQMIKENTLGTTMKKADILKICAIVNLKLLQEELLSENVDNYDILYYYKILKQIKVSNSDENFSCAVMILCEYIVRKTNNYYKSSSYKDKSLGSQNDIYEMIGMLYGYFGKRAFGEAIGYPKNFVHMKNLMKNARKNVNKGYVVFCFNLITDWFNYILYLSKKDVNIFAYRGLALKQEACDYFCIESAVGIAYELTNGFWEEAERIREEMVKGVIDNWEVSGCIYRGYSRLYDKVVNYKVSKNKDAKNKSILGTHRDFLEYWMQRFGDGVIEEIWGEDNENI